MSVRFYFDPGTNEPHIYRHGVSEGEAEDVLMRPMEDRQGKHGARVALGQTRAGRYLRVIYVREGNDDLFVLTAFDLSAKALRALRRRRKKKI